MITTLAVEGYRSLRDVVLPLDRLTVVTGANGSGKSNLYKAFRLLADVADGRLISSLAGMGGLSSVLWAGPEQVSGAMRRGEAPVQGTSRRTKAISLQMGFATDELGYLVDVGLPVPAPTMFFRDPVIKREVVFHGPVMRPATTLAIRPKGLDGRASLLDEHPDPDAHPDVAEVRSFVRGWRFYDSFRTDPGSPSRQPQVGTYTPVLDHDGIMLAPAVQTILESAWSQPFGEAVADAFDGARVEVVDRDGRFELLLQQHGLLRPLTAAELSDGTLRYLLLAAALLGPRAPSLLVLNEPETSLHPDVVGALARLVVQASRRSQTVVITHSAALVSALEDAGARHHELVKDVSETRVADQGLLTRPQWAWGRR